MIVAPQALNVVKPEVVVPAPKQTKVLGATVKGVGLITAVSAKLFDCFALIEDASGKEHHAFLADLKKEQLIFPTEPMPYRAVRRRVGYGLWADMLELELVELSDLTHDLPACQECGGDGYFIEAAGWAEESYKACEVCGGTGKVDDVGAAA
jgi:hypothetical protein